MERQAKDGTIYQKVGEDSWEPVTRAAKDGTVYKKIGADQWIKHEQEQAPERELGFFETVDAYTGAPSRAAVGALQSGKNPLSAFSKQFGEDPQNAPSGRDIAKKTGISDVSRQSMSADEHQAWREKYGTPLDKAEIAAGKKFDAVQGPTPAGVAGVAFEATIDPLNLIPIGAIAKGVGVAAEAAPKLKQAASLFQKQGGKAAAQATALSKATIEGGEQIVEQGGKLFKYKAPESLEELKNWKAPKDAGQLIGSERLQEIERLVPDLETKPLKYHYGMMENPKAMKELKLKFENLPTEDAKRLAAYNQGIVDESALKVQQTVANIAGGSEPRNLTDAGYDFIGSVKEKYKAEKDTLGPLFQQIQERAPRLGADESRDLVYAIGQNSKLGGLIDQNQAGRFVLKKNTPRTGLSDAEHGVLARVIDDLNDGMTFKEIQDTREFLRKAVDPSNPGASSEVTKVRSLLLGQLEGLASKAGPDVGDTFRRYAINERARESIESVIGGKIESLDAMFAANPDRVVQKVFSNPNYAKVVGEYVGPEKMRELAAAYIQAGVGKAFDSAKGFQPSKLKSWLKTNEGFLRANLDPQTAERLNALADYGYFGKRFLDEVNPSGTAASLKEMLEPQSLFQKVRQKGIVGTVTGEVAAKAESMLNQRSAMRTVNEMMGAAPKERTSAFAKIPGSKIASTAQGSNAFAQIASRDARAIGSSVEKDDRTPLKGGPSKWAADGFKKVEKFLNGVAKAESLIADPKSKAILVRISDLSPGSRAFESEVKRLKAYMESKERS
jgi:hypothetical protein